MRVAVFASSRNSGRQASGKANSALLPLMVASVRNVREEGLWIDLFRILKASILERSTATIVKTNRAMLALNRGARRRSGAGVRSQGA